MKSRRLNWQERMDRCARAVLPVNAFETWHEIRGFRAESPVYCAGCKDGISGYGAAVWRLVCAGKLWNGSVMHYQCGLLLKKRYALVLMFHEEESSA